MVNSISEAFSELDFYEYHKILLDNKYYDVIFPFLILYAVLFTVLSRLKLFKSNKTGEPFKAVIAIISLIVSWIGVNFETSPGQSVGSLMMTMFPNVSALSIGFLALYLVGAILGKNFFKGLFSKKYSSFIYQVAGGLGLSAIVFYTGIAMGFWDYRPFDQASYWNFVVALFLLMLGITFLIIGVPAVGILLLTVLGAFWYNSGEGNILEYFVDPFVFIFVLVIFMLTWLNSDSEEKSILAKKLRDSEKTRQKYHDDYGRKPKDYESRIYDIVDETYEDNVKKWKKKYGNNEDWKL